jgi:hypothetical protein
MGRKHIMREVRKERGRRREMGRKHIMREVRKERSRRREMERKRKDSCSMSRYEVERKDGAHRRVEEGEGH